VGPLLPDEKAEPHEHGRRQNDQLSDEDLAGESAHPVPHGVPIVTAVVHSNKASRVEQNEQNLGLCGKDAMPAKPRRNTVEIPTVCTQR
jgi:hypothetical protein